MAEVRAKTGMNCRQCRSVMISTLGDNSTALSPSKKAPTSVNPSGGFDRSSLGENRRQIGFYRCQQLAG